MRLEDGYLGNGKEDDNHEHDFKDIQRASQRIMESIPADGIRGYQKHHEKKRETPDMRTYRCNPFNDIIGSTKNSSPFRAHIQSPGMFD
jgi:hypothetical protein